MLFFALMLALTSSPTPAPEHSDFPAVSACLTNADRPYDEARSAVTARRFALASHLFAIVAEIYDRCARSVPHGWNPGDTLMGSDRLLLAGQAAHLAGNDERARALVTRALRRYEALEKIVPQPESGFYLNVHGSKESAEDDLRGTWTIF